MEKSLIENPDLPISSYNYSAIRDRLLKRGIIISVPTIIERAKALGCYRAKPKKKAHDREVVTTAIGALIQHDASHHRWSPYAQEKWVLISSMDDFSWKLLFADLFEAETSWAHIQASEVLLRRYKLPLRYYVDSLRVFRFVRNRDSFWYKTVLKTDEADPQWKQVMRTMGVDIIYALSPQAKGKIERSYRWLQDRIVRTAAIEKVSKIKEVRSILQEEIHRCNLSDSKKLISQARAFSDLFPCLTLIPRPKMFSASGKQELSMLIEKYRSTIMISISLKSISVMRWKSTLSRIYLRVLLKSASGGIIKPFRN